ncbi:MAG: winged helix-turn-helix domain-containing protein [Lachnospiraceae bacterium]|nr:winged helix-turn-helix domain-containing protein [Lachnospiraceae bacterium]
MTYLPTKKELTEAILVAFNNDASVILTTTEINDKVAQILHIPEELLLLEDENCSGSKYSYLMRWARTELKQKHKIINPERGKWRLV